MKKAEARLYLQKVIQDDIRHQDYKRVTSLAEDYRKFYTGDGLESFIKEVYQIEIPPQQITSIIPPILKSTQYPFNKVFRVKPVMRKVDFDSDNTEERVQKLEDKVGTYWGGRSLEEYLQFILIEYGYIDPNSWIVTEFDKFNSNKETAKPYPFLVLSDEAIDFEIDNGVVKYLVVLQKIDGKERYTIYLDNDTLVYQETDNKSDTKIKGKYYSLEEYMPKGEGVPAVRIGLFEDIETRGRTFVSMFHKIVPFLKKTLKIDYEGDMSMGDLAFPKRYEYVDDCDHCKEGTMVDGSSCGVCGGTGKAKIHRTATDIREFTLPRDREEIIDLRQMTFTDFPPVEGLRFQQEYKDKLKNQIMSFMFNAEIFDKTQVTATATEKNIQMDNLNDAVYPLAKLYERVWEKVAKQIAVFTDNAKDLILQLTLPADFKFKTLTELMGELSAARAASASIPTISAIEDDINEMLYADRPEELKKIRIKNSLNPFMGYTEEMVRVIISQGLTPKINQVLYSNLEAIMAQLELEQVSPWIYDMNIEKIYEMVKAKADEIAQTLQDEKPAPVERPMFNFNEQ